VYNPENVIRYYNKLGHGEWERLDASAPARVIFHLHMHFLQDQIGPGKSVLDAGCGAGRFSIQIAKSGSKVTLLDISEKQILIAKNKFQDSSFSLDNSQFVVADLCNLSSIPSNTFDTTVCYGGALNYLFDKTDQAIQELMRVTKPGGRLLVSVMSRWGVFRFTIANEKFDPGNFFGRSDYWLIPQVAETGDLASHPEVDQPPRHFFTSEELRSHLQSLGLEDIKLGSAPSISAGLYSRLNEIEKDNTAWKVILGLEEKAYCNDGLLDSGDFLLASGRVS